MAKIPNPQILSLESTPTPSISRISTHTINGKNPNPQIEPPLTTISTEEIDVAPVCNGCELQKRDESERESLVVLLMMTEEGERFTEKESFWERKRKSYRVSDEDGDRWWYGGREKLDFNVVFNNICLFVF